jgi:hypothetical protein
MPRRAALLLTLSAGCAPTSPLAGAWRWSIDDPELASDPAWTHLELSDEAQPSGTFVSFFPRLPREDGGTGGMVGAVVGDWEGATVTLALLPDLSHLLAGPPLLDAWRSHTLELSGVPRGACWDATWRWVEDDGAVVAEGAAWVTAKDEVCYGASVSP